MGNIQACGSSEPGLLLQLYGKTNVSLPMKGGSDHTTPVSIDFEEDFVSTEYSGIPYKYSHLIQRISYEETHQMKKPRYPKMHLGQIKLLFSELLFISKYAHDATKVVYVGAAVGYHISKLADLFPSLEFDLWDPREIILEPRENIKTYKQLFTNEIAEKYATQNDKILFMSDIRNTRIGKLKKDMGKMDELIDNDMILQKNWVQIINPVYAYLKFRLPWFEGKTKYLGGTIYLQPYVDIISTEARLMTNNYTDLVEYDNKEVEEKFAYFNFIQRRTSKYDRWNDIFTKYNLFNCWDNAMGLYITDYYLRKVHGIRSDEETGKLFMDIINYHIKEYGDKYNVLFNKEN